MSITVAPELLQGTIDLHCHTAPDVVPRSVSDLELARLAKAAQMRGMVIKNHFTHTADRARIAMEAVSGIEVFGGIALNHAVGGINPQAVHRMAQIEGRRGRFVWLPTVDAENSIFAAGETRRGVPVLMQGRAGHEPDASLIKEKPLRLRPRHRTIS